MAYWNISSCGQYLEDLIISIIYLFGMLPSIIVLSNRLVRGPVSALIGLMAFFMFTLEWSSDRCRFQSVYENWILIGSPIVRQWPDVSQLSTSASFWSSSWIKNILSSAASMLKVFCLLVGFPVIEQSWQTMNVSLSPWRIIFPPLDCFVPCQWNSLNRSHSLSLGSYERYVIFDKLNCDRSTGKGKNNRSESALALAGTFIFFIGTWSKYQRPCVITAYTTFQVK